METFERSGATAAATEARKSAMQRARYIAGLRDLATWLDENPDMALPPRIQVTTFVDSPADVVRIARHVGEPVTWEQSTSDPADHRNETGVPFGPYVEYRIVHIPAGDITRYKDVQVLGEQALRAAASTR